MIPPHLGHEAGAEPPTGQTNRRNGVVTKQVKGSDGSAPLSVPRDRDGSFEPELVKKGQTRIDGIDDRIIGLYAAWRRSPPCHRTSSVGLERC